MSTGEGKAIGRNEMLTLEISQAGCHCEEGLGGADRIGWGGEFVRKAWWNLYSGTSVAAWEASQQ